MKSGMLDGQGEDEAAQEHEVGGFQVVDANLRLEIIKLRYPLMTSHIFWVVKGNVIFLFRQSLKK